MVVAYDVSIQHGRAGNAADSRIAATLLRQNMEAFGMVAVDRVDALRMLWPI